MSYKCAILGHNYGDAEVEREREEDGKEVVITVREIETCARCDDTRVVSENKEVTTMETAADIVADDLAEGQGRSDDAADQPAESGTGPATTQTGQSSGYDPEIPDAESEVPKESIDPEEDDAVILDDDEEDEAEAEPEDGREPGEWPDEAEGAEEDDEDVPQTESEPDWPDEDANEGEKQNWELPSDIDPHPESEGAGNRPGRDALTVPEGEFYCEVCGFTTSVESSSLRAGDFCPECHKGTLEHQRD